MRSVARYVSRKWPPSGWGTSPRLRIQSLAERLILNHTTWQIRSTHDLRRDNDVAPLGQGRRGLDRDQRPADGGVGELAARSPLWYSRRGVVADGGALIR